MPPGRLPLKDLINGLLRTFFKALRYWLHYLIVAFCWLGVVPITASRIYRCLFAGSVSSILTLPYDIVSTDHLLTDVLQGGLVVFCSLGAFICLLWLREQILTGGGPAWLQPADPDIARQPVIVPAPAVPEVNVIVPAVIPANEDPAAVPHDEGAFIDAEDNEDEDDDEDEDAEEEQDNAPVPAVAAAAAAAEAAPVLAAGNAQNQEHNHNWIDWERAADDLTWERLLGLDGSLQFLEHVFWVVTLNTLFILIFAYAPYHLGKIVTSSKTFRRTIADTRFITPINTLTTYGKFHHQNIDGLLTRKSIRFRLCQCIDWLYFHIVYSSDHIYCPKFCQLSNSYSSSCWSCLYCPQSGLARHIRNSSLSICLWHLA